MIVGLCSSFAVVPAVSLMTGGSGDRRTVRAASRADSRPGSAAVVSATVTDPASLAAAATSAVSLAAMFRRLVNPGPASAGIVASALAAPAASAPATSAPPTPAGMPGQTSTSPPVAVQGGATAGVTAPPTTAAPAPVAPRAATAHSQQGIASWLDISAGTCANNAAPMGAVITVTSSAGVSVTCKVVSRGPFVVGRVVDLARTTFAGLQLPSQGLVEVSVTW